MSYIYLRKHLISVLKMIYYSDLKSCNILATNVKTNPDDTKKHPNSQKSRSFHYLHNFIGKNKELQELFSVNYTVLRATIPDYIFLDLIDCETLPYLPVTAIINLVCN